MKAKSGDIYLSDIGQWLRDLYGSMVATNLGLSHPVVGSCRTAGSLLQRYPDDNGTACCKKMGLAAKRATAREEQKDQ